MAIALSNRYKETLALFGALTLGIAGAACGGTSNNAPVPAVAPVAAAAPVAPMAPTPTALPGPSSSLPITTMSLNDIGLDADAIDKTADACTDFYQFACGNWIAKTEIPADKPMAMRSFVSIEDKNEEFLHDILEKARTAGKTNGDKATVAVGNYYDSCMDEAGIEKAGMTPIKGLLATIDKVKDSKSLATAVAALHRIGAGALFGFGPTQDSKDASLVIGGLDQGGLGLPERDYYLKTDADSIKLLTTYQNYVEQVLTLGGAKPADAKSGAAAIVAFETELAKISKDKVARRDPVTMYNRLDRKGVLKAAPHFDWSLYFKDEGAPKVEAITVGSPDFFTGMDKLLASFKPADWANLRTYLKFHLYSATSTLIGKKFDDASFAFRATLTGQQEQLPRWKRCVASTEGALGDLVGEVFVKAKFPGKSKEAAEEQVHAITTAMEGNLTTLPWMDQATKDLALKKLHAMTFQIGYPKKWKNYTFDIIAGDYAKNALAARGFEDARQNSKIGKPVDKDDWQMSAPTVNAYYDPQLNGMVFPAGILQPPFYSIDSSIPVNLGAMGVVVGHELTHGFDDQGAQYDSIGNLVNWWAPDTNKQFKAKTQCVIDQYSNYEVLPGVKVNGANTIGENIADIGGVKLAYRAFHSLRANSKDQVVAGGFTEDQQFFLGFGQAWCAKARPDFAKLLVNVDVHSPAMWRVNGALQATPEFATAFGCKAGSKMKPTNQCTVW